MPWLETCIMDERLSFVASCLRGEESMSAVCEHHGISRKTGYKWLSRWREDAEGGLADRSRAPLSRPHAMSEEVAGALVALRGARPHWGPRKLLAHLCRTRPEVGWPAASTIGDLLSRRGLVAGRSRARRPAPSPSRPFGMVGAANDVWSVDFKGWFRTRDGRRCDPLTVSDAHSRYLLACRIVEPTGAGVMSAMDRLLREQGLPRALRSDNGAPFGSTGAGGLTRPAVHGLKLGIALERIDPGCPQQNGRHERMHRTLKAETSRPPAANAAEQQARFDAFREDFNQERPHEALGQTPPAAHWQASPRPYPERVEEPWYDAEHEVRRVRKTGEIRWRGGAVFVSEALAGEPVGLSETEAGDVVVRFCDLDLGLIERRTGKLLRFAPPRPGHGKAAEQNRTRVTHVPGP